MFPFISVKNYNLPRVEEYIYETFDKTDIKIEVMKGQTLFEKEYPW